MWKSYHDLIITYPNWPKKKKKLTQKKKKKDQRVIMERDIINNLKIKL